MRFIKPFELCTYPHPREEAETQRRRKWLAKVKTPAVSGIARIQIPVLSTLKPRFFACSTILWTQEWMAEWAGILEELVFPSMTVPTYFQHFQQRGNILPKMTKKNKKNTALLLEPIISDLSNLYFLLPTYRQILKQRLD